VAKATSHKAGRKKKQIPNFGRDDRTVGNLEKGKWKLGSQAARWNLMVAV
jgi:hypothetical protein